ncbi:PAS domain S-box protein [Salinimicrobium sp. CDJ15-81-2]|nr:PAS domain S-box protein [Salinimicrobium nanhaiense]
MQKATLLNPYLKIFEALPFPCLLLEPVQDKFYIVEANEQYCRFSGKRKEDLKGRVYPQCSPKEHQAEQNKLRRKLALQEAFESGSNSKIECLRCEFTASQGENDVQFWSIENIPLKDEQGRVVMILNMAKDETAGILEKQQIDRKIKTVKEQQHHFFQKNSDGLYSLDKKGNFLSLNEGLAKLAGLPQEELINQSFLPFCSPKDRDQTLECFRKAVAGKNQVFEAEFISAQGEKLLLEISLVPIRGEGSISGVYGIAKDRTSYRLIEEELYRNQKKFQALVHEGSDLIAILGTDGVYKFVSNTTENVLGIPASFYIGKSAFDFIHPDDKDRVLQDFSLLDSEKHVKIDAFRVKDAEGNWRWIETYASNSLDDPYVEGIVVNSRDITPLVEQSMQIKQLYERYTLAAEATEDLIYDWNLETDEVIRFHKSNGGFLGYSRREVDRREFWKSCIHPEELTELKQTLKESLQDPEKTSLKTQYQFRKADGTYAQIIDRANIVRNERGEAIRLIGATSDVSRLMQNKSALKLANKRFSYAMKATKEMIWDWNIEQGHIKRSGAFKKIFGYNTPKDPSVENIWFEKITDEDRERVRESLRAALQDGEIKKWREEYCFVKKDGSRAFVIDRGYILRDKKGNAIRMVGAVLDVTESRRMLREIKKQNEVLREVAWEQAHIVRAPLARLKGLLDLLEQEEYGEWSREELVSLIRTSADEVDKIIGNIIKKTESIEA